MKTAPNSANSKKWTNAFPKILCDNKEHIHFWNGKFYEQIPDIEAKNIIWKHNLASGHDEIASLLNDLKITTYYKKKFHPAIIWDGIDLLINVQNGVLRWNRAENRYKLQKHDPKWLFNAILPVRYDVKAQCPKFMRELQDKLPNVLDQKRLRFCFAYTFDPDCHLNICIFCLGDSRTGKSTLIVHGLGSMIGQELAIALKLEQICKSRKSLSDITWLPLFEVRSPLHTKTS